MKKARRKVSKRMFLARDWGDYRVKRTVDGEAEYGMCDSSFQRVTGLKLKEGEIVEMTIRLGKTVRKGDG